MTTPRPVNWAGNLVFSTDLLAEPTSVAEVQKLVAGAERVKALGSRHCFTAIADTTGTLVSLRHLPRRIEVAGDRMTVTVDGGITYGELAPVLQNQGLALANLASLPHISVAGAIATGTHGSGVANPSLAAAVAGLRLVTASGELHEIRRGEPDFDGAVVSLGALGVVVGLTLDVVPTFEVAVRAYTGLPWASLVERIDAIQSAGYSVSVLPRFGEPALTSTVLVKTRIGDPQLDPAVLDGAAAATEELHLVPGADPAPCTPQLGLAGPWNERLAHFRPDFTPSVGAELQSEYLVPFAEAADALAALHPLAAQLAERALVVEVRAVAAESLWLAMNHDQQSLAIHVTWKPDQPAVEAFLPALEAALGPWSPRPHWGKLFAANPSALYPRFADFADLAARFDPDRKFRNPYLDRLLPGTPNQA